MCGRYELHRHPAAIALAFGLAYPPEIHPRYNIAPMQRVPIARVGASGERELVQVRWGLVPRWAKDPSIATRMINARAETVATRPAYRNAFLRHRCLVPADGFYEWRSGSDGRKQPVRVARADGEPLGLAGLYERWLSPEGEVLDTCTIITTECNDTLRPVHLRMPVIVSPEDYRRWLDPAEPGPAELLVPAREGDLAWWPVSSRVNSVRNDEASLIEPVAASHEPAADAAHAPAQVEDDFEPSVDPVQERLF